MNITLSTKEIKTAKNARATFSRDLDVTSAIDKHFISNTDLKGILESYTMYTHPEYKGLMLKNYQTDLKQDILEYIEDHSCDNTAETLSKLAYFRLEKISKKYYLQNAYGADGEVLKALGKQVKEVHKEYNLLSCLL